MCEELCVLGQCPALRKSVPIGHQETYCPFLSVLKIRRVQHLSLTIKIRMFSPPLCTQQMHGWTVHAEDARILESSHMQCQRQLLGITSVMSTLQTRLVSLQSRITSSNVDASFLATSPGCPVLSQSIKLYAVRLTCLSAVSQTDHGSVVPVVLRNAGWTKSVMTSNAHQPMCGETLSGAVIEE